MFSERENRIIEIISKKKLSINNIEKKLFKDKNIPLNSKILISNSIRRINSKCHYYSLNWSLIKNKENNIFYFSRISL